MKEETDNAIQIEWVVVYDDLSTFDNTQGSFADAPAWGIQSIAFLSKATGWSMCTGGDRFIRTEDGEFLALSKNGFLDYSANVLKTVKVGRMISQQEYSKAHGVACSILGELATKTGYFKRERRV